jgi:hypothetical protein
MFSEFLDIYLFFGHYQIVRKFRICKSREIGVFRGVLLNVSHV